MDFSLEEARGLLVNVTAGTNLALIEVSQVISCIRAAAHPNVNLLFGALIDPDLGNEIRVMAIANGYERVDIQKPVCKCIEADM